MQTKYALEDCPLTFISDDLINAGLDSDYDVPLNEVTFRFICQVIRDERRSYFDMIVTETHGALAKLFAAADAGEVTDPEQLAVVNWLRADDGDVIESYRADDKCKVRDVYRAAIKLAQLALACQVNSDAGDFYPDAYEVQNSIEYLTDENSIASLLEDVCTVAKHACTVDVQFNVPCVKCLDCVESMFETKPYHLSLDEKYLMRLDYQSFASMHEIESEIQEFYNDED